MFNLSLQLTTVQIVGTVDEPPEPPVPATGIAGEGDADVLLVGEDGTTFITHE